MNPVLLTQVTTEALHNLILRRAPVEAVGLLIDDEILELPNRADNGTSNFSFVPEDIAIAIENARIDIELIHWEDVILWHSHPSGGVGPSRTDMRHKVPRVQHMVLTITDDKQMVVTQY